MTRCYYATQTVISAGTGSTFIIQNGGIVNISAGGAVLSLFAGTSVHPGGSFHAFVSPTCIPCYNTNQTLGPASASLGGEETTIPSGIGSGNLFLFPNPANEILNLSLNPSSTEAIQVYIYNTSGHQSIQQNLQGLSTKQMKIGNLKPGLYLVKIITTSSAYTGKFMKQ